MKVVGIDLAGNPKNETGFCVLTTSGNDDSEKDVKLSILYSDQDIIKSIADAKPDIIAVDAPLTYSGVNRRCDEMLREYGALPVTLRGMEVLALRGRSLGEIIKKGGFRVVEVYATASGKILGLYDRDETKMQKSLLKSGLTGDVSRRMLVKDEIDAVFAALTGFLHLKGKTREIGDESGTIIIPDV